MVQFGTFKMNLSLARSFRILAKTRCLQTPHHRNGVEEGGLTYLAYHLFLYANHRFLIFMYVFVPCLCLSLSSSFLPRISSLNIFTLFPNTVCVRVVLLCFVFLCITFPRPTFLLFPNGFLLSDTSQKGMDTLLCTGTSIYLTPTKCYIHIIFNL